MELTFISVIALLLLLSGAATPLRSGASPGCAAVAMRRWFGFDQHRRKTRRASRCRGLFDQLAIYAAAHCRLASVSGLRVRRLSRVLARSRFGAASVVFHPAAPPLA